MKSKITSCLNLLLTCAALLCIGLAASAQTGTSGSQGPFNGTNNGPTDPLFRPATYSTNYVPTGNTFLDQFGQFFTQPDRNLGTWTTTNGAPKTADVYVGSCFEDNINADGILGIDYRFYKYVVADVFTRIFNSNQTIKSIGAGPGVEIPIGDLKVGIYGDLVYRMDDHCVAVEPKISLKNGIGKNAYLMTALATDYEIKSRASQHPFLTTAFGFNF